MHIQEKIEIWRGLVGERYVMLVDEFIRNEDAAYAGLRHSDNKVRFFALDACSTFWRMSPNHDFVAECYAMAVNDPVEAVRIWAVNLLGYALESTRNAQYSRFLANVVCNPDSPDGMRRAAYWSLRHIQLGWRLDDSVKYFFENDEVPSDVEKELDNRFPNWREAEAEIKALFKAEVPAPIDWDFVRKFASAGSA
jgi:hypothetical protein